MLIRSSISRPGRAVRRYPRRAIAISPRLTQVQGARTSQTPIESQSHDLRGEARARRAGKPIMTDAEAQKLTRENDYLKLRCAQLQDDVTDLGSQVARLLQELERYHAARGLRAAGPAL
jgi:hypothetical protein